MKLLAIDGNSIINRAFYGIKLLTTKDGKYTNAVYGFINILNKLLELEHPDGVAVAFDLKSPTFRHKMYEQYKAGRHAMPNELAEQFPTLKNWLTLAGYSCIECEGFEADDILGTLARSAKENGNECVIATGDRDSLQLVSDNTRVLLTATKMGKPEIINYTPDAVLERYGVTPKEMIELKALMGDSSDNIPGVSGVGEKTATDLVSRFHSIDYIYENIDTLDIKDSVKRKLIDGKESAYLSRTLGTICLTAPISTDFDGYKTRPMETQKLSALMTSLEFFKLMERMGIKPSASIENTEKSDSKQSFTVCEFLSDIKKADIFESDGIYSVVSDKKVFKCDEKQFKDILSDERTEKRVYDYKNLYKKYPDIKNVKFDLSLAGYLCNPSSNDYSLERLCKEYNIIEPEIIGEADESIKNAVMLRLASDKLTEILTHSDQLDLLYDIEVPLARVLGEMEISGFLVDCNGLKTEGEELSEKISNIQNDIYSLAGEQFNINSPKQLGEILFGKLGIPTKKKTKSGYSTNADVLESLKYDFPIVGLVLEYRKLAKLKSTYCDGLLNAVSPDGRIHSTFNQTEARTGRISSLEPNLQNIPVRTDEGRKLRKYFIAKDGYVLCDADYSQIELRVLASIANDSTMINAFNSGADIHTITASEVFDIPADMVLPIMRSRAKAVNFGIVYGIGAFSLAKDIGVSRAEADRYIKDYLATYPAVDEYMKNVISKAKLDGYVTTEFGRRRYLPELSASNGNLRAFGERVARNAPIQGTAADIIKIAMINVNNRLKKELPDAKLILQVHDELIVECKESDSKAVCSILEEEMQNAAKLKVKLCVDANCGKNWLEAKG
ncbi:MAG: DNA polymerase I [Clostridia bacterium]|nr:DNA polymerase I [Clostridia bacterium]